VQRICFYHAGCPDGFGAAWSAWNAWGDAGRYVPITHDEVLDLSRYEGDLVAFVDIVPSNEDLLGFGEIASQVIVLDHHISSLNRYNGEPAVVNAMEDAGHLVHFDLSHSGAVLSWHYFNDSEPVPDLLQYVEDQDLWSWKLPFSQEVNATLASYPMRFEVWAELAARPVEELAREGASIVRSNRAEVARCLHHAHPLTIQGRRVQAVNSAYERAAIGHELAKRADHGLPWGCVYRLEGHTVHATLYSIGDFDVATTAAEFGGGGHRNAAGFNLSLDRWLQECV